MCDELSLLCSNLRQQMYTFLTERYFAVKMTSSCTLADSVNHTNFFYKDAHIFERNLLTADMLEPQLPLCGVTMDAVIPSRVWADFLKREKPHWRLVHWTQGKQLGFNPPPCHSNFVVQKHTKCEDIQRVAKIDLWALGFSPTYLAERHPEFLVQIQ